jgi:signal transduction histidine kinase
MNDLEAERDAVLSLLDARRELIASVSHELRTPVAILRGHQESLLDGSTAPSPDELRHGIAIMAQATLNLQRLIDDLFTLSRAEVNQLEIERRQVAVETVVRRCAESAGPSIWATGRVELALDIAPDLPAALVDETRLEQIVYNLLRNSARHTPPGGIIAIRVFADTGCIVLQVSDTGEGITPQDLPHIWERFYRADSARALDSGGSGLGLALVKELTEAMGGSVSAESRLGQGSSFTLRLPCGSA